MDFRVLPLGIYDGVLGMDWLVDNKGTLKYKEGMLMFLDSQGYKATVAGHQDKPQLQLVLVTKLFKGL